MAQTKNIVKKFIDSPYQITGFTTYYRLYVALLHLLLVRHKEKKCVFWFINPEQEEQGFTPLYNVLKICKKLKFKPNDWKQVDTQFNEKIPRTRKMNKEMAECIVKVSRRDSHLLFCSMDRAFLAEIVCEDHEEMAEIEQYPSCCADAFIENKWEEYEIAVSTLGKPVAQSRVPAPAYRDWVGKRASELGVPVELYIDADFVLRGNMLTNEQAYDSGAEDLLNQISLDRTTVSKKIYDKIANTIRKYPFVSHRACEGCLRDVKNSPTAIMNKQYSGFCKREHPELYEGIIAEATSAADEATNGANT